VHFAPEFFSVSETSGRNFPENLPVGVLLAGIFSAWNFAVVFRGWPQGQQLDCRATLKLPLTARSAIRLPRYNQNRGIYEQLLLRDSQQQLLRDMQEMLLTSP
jgi:hypothetical protein